MANEKDNAGIESVRAILAQEYRDAAKSRYLHRLHCVLLMLHGYCRAKVAGWFFHDETTLARWGRLFERYGVAGLRDRKRTGRPLALQAEQLAELRQALGVPPAECGFANAKEWSGKLVAIWLERRYGVSFSLRHCQRLLRELRADAAASARKPVTNSR